MPASVRVGGAWKSVSAVSTRVGGAWKNVGSAWTRVGGLWKQWLSGDSAILLFSEATSTIAFTWSNGFGTQYNSGNVTSRYVNGGPRAKFSKSNLYIAFGNSSQSYIAASTRTTDQVFGTKFADPSSLLPNVVYGIDFTNDDSALAACFISTPFVGAYAWSSSGFGSRFSNPATLPSDASYDLDFSPDGSSLITTNNSTYPFVSAYRWSTSGFGTQYAQAPSSVYNGVYNIQFNSTSSQIALHVASVVGYIAVFPWNSSTGFGTEYTKPTGLDAYIPTGSPSWGLNNTALAISNNGPKVYAFSSTGFGTQYSNPVGMVTGAGEGIFAKSGTVFAHAINSSPFIHAYNFIPGSGFGSKFSDPSVAPTQYRTRIDFG